MLASGAALGSFQARFNQPMPSGISVDVQAGDICTPDYNNKNGRMTAFGISGTEGKLFSVVLKADENFAADGTLTLQSILCYTQGNNVEIKVDPIALNLKLKTPATVTAPVAKELTYTGEAQELIVAGMATGGELLYSLDATNYSAGIPTGINAGTYTVYYKAIADDYHTDSDVQTIVVTIKKADGNVAVAQESVSKIFGDEPFSVAATLTGDGSVTYASTNEEVVKVDANGLATIVGAGEASITVTVVEKEGGNYTYATKTLTIGIIVVKATIDKVELAASELIYNAKNQTFEVTAVKAGELTLTPDDYTVTGNTVKEVGEYDLTVTATGNNFQGVITVKVTIVENVANNDAKTRLEAEIAALQDALDAITINEDDVLAADYATLTAQQADIQTAINELLQWVAEQHTAAQLNAESVLPANTVATDIESLKTALENAKAAKEAADKKAANDAAYESLKAELDALDEAIEAAKEEIEENAPNVKDDYLPLLDELQDKVDAAREALEAANAAEALTEESTNGDVPTQEDIDAIVKAAKDAEDNYQHIQVPIPGDVDGSGEVDGTDLNTFINNLLNGNTPADPASDEFFRYDANGDGIITIADAQAILNLSLGFNVDGSEPSEARSTWNDNMAHVTMSFEKVSMGNGTSRYAINLQGGISFTGIQMDVAAPGNMVVTGHKLVNNTSILSSNTMQNGKYRIAGLLNGEMTANGTVLYVYVMGEGNVRFENVALTNAAAQSIAVIGSETTGINSIGNGQWTTDNGYDLNGRKLMQGSKKGLVITNGKKVVLK